MRAAVYAFADETDRAEALAAELGIANAEIALHRFPDGESLIRVTTPAAPVAVLYRSLHNPNAKLVELLLTASALRDSGARKVILVAPYLAYMRQDIAFHPGEAVSQRVIGDLIASAFDACVTVDPHLHRIHSLSEVMPGVIAVSLNAAPVLSAALDSTANPLIVGPDEESLQWVRSIAEPMGLDYIVGRKQRTGDRDISIHFDAIAQAQGRSVVLVDDVISSGTTLVVAARQLLAAGATRIEAMATHCLANAQDLEGVRASGIEKIRSTDSVACSTAEISLARLLAEGIKTQGLLE